MPVASRRSVLRAALWVAAAPTIVRASSLMPVRALAAELPVIVYDDEYPFIGWPGMVRLELSEAALEQAVIEVREYYRSLGFNPCQMRQAWPLT